MRRPFSSSVRTSRCRPSRSSSVCENFIGRINMQALCAVWVLLQTMQTPRRGVATTKSSWEQAAHLFRFDDAFDADGHGRCAMRNFVFLCSPYHLRKRMLKDAEEFVGHFRFRPQKCLQTLHPLEVRNDHAAGVAENIRDHENFVPALFENPV